MTDFERQRIEAAYDEYDKVDAATTRWSPEVFGNQLIVAERRRRILEAIGTPTGLILDLGCGSGGDERILRDSGSHANVVGLDLQLKLLQSRKSLIENSVSVHGSGTALPFANGAFSLVILSTVLSSILDDAIQAQLAQEVLRVLASNGRVVAYDMRVQNPQNRSVRPVKVQRFHELFPGGTITSQRVTVIPQIARLIPRRGGWAIYRALGAVPFLRSHRVTQVTKQS